MPRTGRPPRDPVDRFQEKYEASVNGHWVWQASAFRDRGYEAGQFWDGEHNVRAHRWAWEYWVGPIPDGQQLYATCDTALCVAPAHHELGPANRLFAAKTHCPAGHKYAGDNLYTNPTSGGRMCRTCHRTKAADATRRGRGRTG